MIEIQYKETDYKRRIPAEKYKMHKELEDLVLSLQCEEIKCFVVCPGVFYGKGEQTFRNHFKHAWLQDPEALPYLNEGNNLIPTIHLRDLTELVFKLAEEPPEQPELRPYILAIDNGKLRT